MSGKQVYESIASTIMDLDYDGEEGEVAPVVFTSGVNDIYTNTGIGFERVSLIRRWILYLTDFWETGRQPHHERDHRP